MIQFQCESQSRAGSGREDDRSRSSVLVPGAEMQGGTAGGDMGDSRCVWITEFFLSFLCGALGSCHLVCLI